MKKEKYFKLYKAWLSMKYKCGNSNSSLYKSFGGKGISYAAEWADYEVFRKDMLPEFVKLLEEGMDQSKITLSRIDRDKDFSKENCKWSSLSENRKVLLEEKHNFLVAQRGSEQKHVFSSLKDLAEFYNVSRTGASKALHNGNNYIKDVIFTKITPEEFRKSLKSKTFLSTLQISYNEKKYERNKERILKH